MSWTAAAWRRAGFADVGVREMDVGGGLAMGELGLMTDRSPHNAPEGGDHRDELTRAWHPGRQEPDRAGTGGRRTETDLSAVRPAYYAARSGPWQDWWTLLHPPYTVWHLSYVVIGASLAPHVRAALLVATVLAFFVAVGVAAHALDELHGRPLRTRIPTPALLTVTVAGLAGTLALGIAGISRVGRVLIPFMAVGPALVVAYNAELAGGVLHTDLGFAAAWGAFPVLTGYAAQTGTLTAAPVAAAVAAVALSTAQRRLSTPARALRRRTARVDGDIMFADGEVVPLRATLLLKPLEGALQALSWGVALLAAALAIARLG